ncbi:hypothetical protein M8C21_004802, partial [Ambrosia artemisiifolia]
FFFKIANHNLTVVAVDAAYTNPLQTDVVVVGPGQTTDVLLTANQSPGLYYMVANPYANAVGVPFNGNTTTGILSYPNATQTTPIPILPVLPVFNDTPTAFTFSSNLTALVTSPFWSPVPQTVDEKMFITMGLGLSTCGSNQTCGGIFGQRMAASMNNNSFVLPTRMSLLEAFFRNVSGVYTTDFPDGPPMVFDYTNVNNSFNQSLLMTPKLTNLKKIKFNSTVEIVLQNTALIGIENHPMHLHGFNFYNETHWECPLAAGLSSDSEQIILVCGLFTAIWKYICHGVWAQLSWWRTEGHRNLHCRHRLPTFLSARSRSICIHLLLK